jgi:hypothetical protein
MEERRREALSLREQDRAEEAALAVAAWQAAVAEARVVLRYRLREQLARATGAGILTSQRRTAVGSHRG